MQRSGHPRISLESSKSSKGSVQRESATRRHSRVTSPTVAPVGTPVELGHLQQAREFLDEIRQDLIGDGDHHADGISQSLQGDLTFSKTKSIGEFPRDSGKTLMTAVQRSELHRLLRTKGSGSDMDRLAELCCKMHFFKRLTQHQLLEFLTAAEFFEKDTAGIIYRDGDPLGNVYVVLNGSVVIHRALQEDAMGGKPRGHCRAFVSSCFDGRAFGDGWDFAGKQSVRCTTAVAQEKSLLLRLDTETYREVLRKGDVCSDHAAALRELPFLQECSANELESLLLMLETVTFHYLSRVLEPFQQPLACHVLKQGRCEIRAFGIEVKELLPGAFFGLGVLLGLSYGAPKGIEIQVSSMTAQFYWIKRKSLLPLPDVVQDSILKSVRELVDAQQAPEEWCISSWKFNIDYDIFAGLETPGFIKILTKAELVLMTTTEDLQDPAPPEVLEVYQKAGVHFVGVGPLLDQTGALRAAAHKFETGVTSSSSADVLKQVREAGRRVVYASMGTVLTGDSPDFGWTVKTQRAEGRRKGLTGKQLCQAAFGAVFDAFGENSPPSEAPLIVMSTGPQPDALENLEVPENAVCVPEVPQVDLLRCGVDVFLTHFGQNSFMESLSVGIPMVGCPGFADQPANAQKAQAMGVALQVDRPVPEDGEEPAAMQQYRKEVAQALRRVACEPCFKERAEEVSRGIKEAGGVARATKILLEVASATKLPTLLTSQAAEVMEKSTAVTVAS